MGWMVGEEIIIPSAIQGGGERFGTIVEVVEDGVYIAFPDLNGNVRLRNDELVQYKARKREVTE